MLTRLITAISAGCLFLAQPCTTPLANADPLDQHINDETATLSRSYAEDLNRRLNHYAEKAGYGIYVVMLPDRDAVEDFMPRLFASERLDNVSPYGSVALVIARQKKEARIADARIATSKNLNRRFTRSKTITGIEKQLGRVGERQYLGGYFQIESAVEYSVVKMVEAIDPWLYVLEPSHEAGDYHSYLAEIILLPLAPFSALMAGIFLMAFTRVGSLGVWARSVVGGVSASLLAIAEALLLREPGGILPAGLYYGVLSAFLVGTTVGALKPFWFNDKFTGKKSDAWWSGPVHFYRG